MIGFKEFSWLNQIVYVEIFEYANYRWIVEPEKLLFYIFYGEILSIMLM